jgi:hypothetical protein
MVQIPVSYKRCDAVRVKQFIFPTPPDLAESRMSRWSAALPSLLGSRLLLNMRERAYKTEVYTGDNVLDSTYQLSS